MVDPARLFPIRPDELFLDCAASVPPFYSTMKAVDSVMREYGSIHRGFGERSTRSSAIYESSRNRLLDLMQAKEHHSLVFTANTTDALNKLTFSLLNRGEETGRYVVIVSEYEHSANLLPYARYGNFEIVTISSKVGIGIDLHHLDELLRQHAGNILAVCLAGTPNVPGRTLDVEAINRVIKNRDPGAIFAVDASQYAPHHPIVLDNADVWAVSGHKAYAPYGVGFLAGKREFLDWGDFGFSGGGNIEYIRRDGFVVPKPVPWGQEVGTPNLAGAVALAESFRMLYEEIGFQAISEHEQAAHDILLDVLRGHRSVEILSETPGIALVQIRASRPFDEVASTLSRFGVQARSGHFCTFRYLEDLLGIEGEPTSADPILDSHVIRFSVGLCTNLESFHLLDEALSHAV